MTEKRIVESSKRTERNARKMRGSLLANRSRNNLPDQADADNASSEIAGPDQANSTAKSGKPKIKSSDITGLMFFDQLGPLLQRLHDDGCERDRAPCGQNTQPNRKSRE